MFLMSSFILPPIQTMNQSIFKYTLLWTNGSEELYIFSNYRQLFWWWQMWKQENLYVFQNGRQPNPVVKLLWTISPAANTRYIYVTFTNTYYHRLRYINITYIYIHLQNITMMLRLYMDKFRVIVNQNLFMN